jgi:hypothetical protein
VIAIQNPRGLLSVLNGPGRPPVTQLPKPPQTTAFTCLARASRKQITQKLDGGFGAAQCAALQPRTT